MNYYPKLTSISKHFADKLNIEEGRIFFFNNYTNGNNPRDIYKEYMGLYILEKTIDAGKSKIESLYSQMYYKAVLEEGNVRIRVENYKPIYELK